MVSTHFISSSFDPLFLLRTNTTTSSQTTTYNWSSAARNPALLPRYVIPLALTKPSLMYRRSSTAFASQLSRHLDFPANSSPPVTRPSKRLYTRSIAALAATRPPQRLDLRGISDSAASWNLVETHRLRNSTFAATRPLQQLALCSNPPSASARPSQHSNSPFVQLDYSSNSDFNSILSNLCKE